MTKTQVSLTVLGIVAFAGMLWVGAAHPEWLAERQVQEGPQPPVQQIATGALPDDVPFTVTVSGAGLEDANGVYSLEGGEYCNPQGFSLTATPDGFAIVASDGQALYQAQGKSLADAQWVGALAPGSVPTVK